MTSTILFIIWRVPLMILTGIFFAAFEAVCELRDTFDAIRYEWRNLGKKEGGNG
jgi:hypothetical protein